jgi:type IV secretion system protein VirB11
MKHLDVDPRELSRRRIHTQLKEELGGLLNHLEDPDVEDIHANANGWVWVKRRGAPKEQIMMMPETQRRQIINTVAALAGGQIVVTYDHPTIEAVLPFGGCRFKGLVPPRSSAPAFSIRTRPMNIIPLAKYVDDDTLSPEHKAKIAAALQDGRTNMLVAGGTGSGKTTLTNALLAEISQSMPWQRIVTIEDTPELQCESPDYIALHATEGTTMGDCLKDALRLSPDRIIVGEVRREGALDLVMAWNTGHPGGLGTIHANDAVGALHRLDMLCRMVTQESQAWLIAETINLLVFIQKDPQAKSGRRVTEVLRVNGFRNGMYVTEEL